MTMEMPKFTKRFFEEVVVLAVGAGASDFIASGFNFTHAGVAAALGAAFRAVYGFVVKPLGDTEKPSVVK
jgi:hypothetical protein